MERNGNFEQTMNLKGFMRTQGFVKANLVKNPNTGKVFGVFISADGSETRTRVSEKVVAIGDLTEDMSVSLFTPEDGDSSWMIHPTGNRNQNVVAEFSLEADLAHA